jgi:hypothetical protein
MGTFQVLPGVSREKCILAVSKRELILLFSMSPVSRAIGRPGLSKVVKQLELFTIMLQEDM